MTHDVFISHSSLDKPAADAVCHGLEAKGIRCWIAPRDQGGRTPYGQQITSAIESAQVMVLIFSNAVNNSQAVLNEINIAAEGANVTIVPFRLAKVDFNPELHFYLGRMHWLDAFPQPVDAYIDALVDTIQRNLKPPAARARGGRRGRRLAGVLDPARRPGGDPSAGTARSASDAPGPDRRRRAGRTGPGPADRGRLAASAEPGAGPGGQHDDAGGRQRNRQGCRRRRHRQHDKTGGGDSSQPIVGDGTDVNAVRPSNAAAVAMYEQEVIAGGPPATLPGATVINTYQLVTRLKARDAGTTSFWLIDARGCTTEPTIPTSICLNPDTIGALETQVPDKSTEIVAFCHDGACPMSFQMASQALADGYSDVVWYRGGINAWMAAGGPTIVRGPVTQ